MPARFEPRDKRRRVDALNRVLTGSVDRGNEDSVGVIEAVLEFMKTAMNDFSVITVTLHPGIRASTIKAALQGTTPPVKGIVLQAYGAGNAPHSRHPRPLVRRSARR